MESLMIVAGRPEVRPPGTVLLDSGAAPSEKEALHPLMTFVRSGILMALVIKHVKCDRKSEEGRMRVSKAQAAHNREEILTSAARLFREHGIDATGVDSITAQAGLTHGGLYSQFGSKQAIVTEAIRFSLAESKSLWRRTAQSKPAKSALSDIVTSYLSRAHRDAPGRGCLVAALSGDITRQPEAVRGAFAAELKDLIELLAALMPARVPARRRADAAAALASMVGALVLARAVNDEALSDGILDAGAERVCKMAKVRPPLRRGSRKNKRPAIRREED
jgi:TetR/AcrR family transcriptional repressor of nem operon